MNKKMGDIASILDVVAEISVALVVLLVLQAVLSIARYYIKLKAFLESREWIKDFVADHPEYTATDIAMIADAFGSHRIQFDDKGKLPIDQMAELAKAVRR